MIDRQPAVFGVSGWQTIDDDGIEIDGMFIGIVHGDGLLDASRSFRIIELAGRRDCCPVIWNIWEELPTDSSRLVSLMMGRSIECCAPVLLSDVNRIHEHVELANRNKIPVRRFVPASGEVEVDLDYAWGLENAFKMVTNQLNSPALRRRALDRYKSLV